MHFKKMIFTLVSSALFMPCGAMQKTLDFPKNRGEMFSLTVDGNPYFIYHGTKEEAAQSAFNQGYISALQTIQSKEEINEKNAKDAYLNLKKKIIKEYQEEKRKKKVSQDTKTIPSIKEAGQQNKQKKIVDYDDEAFKKLTEEKQPKPAPSFWEKCKTMLPTIAVFAAIGLGTKYKLW